MDFNFTRGPKSANSDQDFTSNKKSLLKFLKLFFPVFVLAAFLPALVGLAIGPTQLGFFTRADSSNEVRVWIEPKTVIAEPGVPIEFAVFVLSVDDEKLIPAISLDVEVEGPLVLGATKLETKIPFKGKIEIGKITANPLSAGDARIKIRESSVNIVGVETPLEIITTQSKIIIQN